MAVPLSITFPRQGHRFAVGFQEGVQLFDEKYDTSEILPPASPLEGKTDLLVDSQRLSFSGSGNHLVVASRAAQLGKVFLTIHDLQPLDRKDRQLPDIPIPGVCAATLLRRPSRELPDY